MKKIFTLALITFVAIVARATDYNEPIVVTVNGVTSEQPGVLSVVENGDAYDMTMKNFMLAGEDGPIGVVVASTRFGERGDTCNESF